MWIRRGQTSHLLQPLRLTNLYQMELYSLSPSSTPSKSSHVYSSNTDETCSPRTIGPIRTILSRSRQDVSRLDNDSPRHTLEYGSPSAEGRKHHSLRPKSEYYPKDFPDFPSLYHRGAYNHHSMENVRNGGGDDDDDECDIVPFQRRESMPTNGKLFGFSFSAYSFCIFLMFNI